MYRLMGLVFSASCALALLGIVVPLSELSLFFFFFFKEGHVLQETALGRNARHAKPR